MIVRLLLALAFPLTLMPAVAHAFPENVRHGYVNCTSCHVSPTGGGTLTPYGRALSSELMSTWSYKGEEGFLHGAIKEEKMPEWLMIGGDLRALQHITDTPAATTAKWVPMQEDIEAAVRFSKVTLDLEFGHIEDPNNKRWGSRRYFAMYNITDEITARVGRFYPQFGIYMPDHYVPTKSGPALNGFSFDEGMERDSFELAWNGENYSAFLTASHTPGEQPEAIRETAVSAQVDKNLGDSAKVGVSLWSGNSSLGSRQLAGVHGIIGFTKRLFWLAELDHQWTTSRGLFVFNRLGYEIVKGLIGFGQVENKQADLQSPNGSDAYGLGLQFFPRPHFEFEGLYRKLRAGPSQPFGDDAFLLLHYYW